MEEFDVIDYLGIHKEKLAGCLKEEEYNLDDKVRVFFRCIAESEEEARLRKISHLVSDTQKKCKKYLDLADSGVQKNILYLYGRDDDKQVHILGRIQENVENTMKEIGKTEITQISFSWDSPFTNVVYRQLCPACSCMVDCYKAGIMKKYAMNERCSSARNKSSFSFTTICKGIWVKITIISDCPGCCPHTDNFIIKSVPAIENINEHQMLLIDHPLDFVEQIVIGWIKRNYLV